MGKSWGQRTRLALLLMALSMRSLFGADLFVPNGGEFNYPTIKTAIAACHAGDVIHVQPGIYKETLSFRNIDFTLTSMNPADSNVVASTILEGDGIKTVVTYSAGQTTNALLTGFTIRGGGYTRLAGAGFTLYLGGGIYCNGANPTIRGNVIEGNKIDTNSAVNWSGGGGIACLTASPIVQGNLFRNNTAFAGGAIFSDSGKPVFSDNIILSNHAVIGGGAYFNDHGEFINNTLYGNEAESLNVENTSLVLNNIIASTLQGAAIVVGPFASDPTRWFLFNDLWNNPGGDIIKYARVDDRGIGISDPVVVVIPPRNGNFSADPFFANADQGDFHLLEKSPCLNSGEMRGIRIATEKDFQQGARVVGGRVDLGALETSGNSIYPPSAVIVSHGIVQWNGSDPVKLDATGSTDPQHLPLTYEWQQKDGPVVTFFDQSAKAQCIPSGLGRCTFQLIVNNGTYQSSPAFAEIIITNYLPIASAGIGFNSLRIPESLTLNGSHCFDPEGAPLKYLWQQLEGPPVIWENADSAKPTVLLSRAGSYVFELVVRDKFNSSLPSKVTYHFGSVLPVALAGPTRYAGRKPVMLDGSQSFSPNDDQPLIYYWRQVSGPTLTLSNATTAFPIIQGFPLPATKTEEAVFELIVQNNVGSSAPDLVKIIIVPGWKGQLNLSNPPFDPKKPSIVGFSGGNCDTGDAFSYPNSWRPLANLFSTAYSRDASSTLTEPHYYGYGDQLITYLSENAPYYDQSIQVLGWSTGVMPAFDVAERFNTFYKDPRYFVNRVTLLDSGCPNKRDYNTNIAHLTQNVLPGKQFWVDNYYAVGGRFRSQTFNVEFPVPPAIHSTPNTWYFGSWSPSVIYSPDKFNNGIYSGAFFSVLGPGKNYRVEDASELYFGWAQPKSGVYSLAAGIQVLPHTYPAVWPGLVELTGPSNESKLSFSSNEENFSCKPVLNAETYQLLIGKSANDLTCVAWQGSEPPDQPLKQLPFPITYWTVKAITAQGASSQAEARFVVRDSDGDGLDDLSEVSNYHTDPERADSDGDGTADGLELAEGSDPTNPTTGLCLKVSSFGKGQLFLSWFAKPNRVYNIQRSKALEANDWESIKTVNASSSGGAIEKIITFDGSAGFYRVIEAP